MEPSSRAWSPCSSRHHHHHHHPWCHHHHPFFRRRHHHLHLLCSHPHHPHPHPHQPNCALHVSRRFALQAAEISKPILSYPLEIDLNLESTASKETSAPVTRVLQEPEWGLLEEEEEEEDPIFVLTDEWREFFARSEAKRKLEKQQAKKKEKH